MTEQYLNSLVDGLSQKEILLDKLSEATKKQYDIVSEEKADWDEFDKLVDVKSEMIDKLNTLDAGFDAVFERVKDELDANRSKYADYIRKLQQGIKAVTEKSTSLLALEERTKAKVTSSFSNEKRRITQSRTCNKAAANYYNNMNQINFIDPQLMDQKK